MVTEFQLNDFRSVEDVVKAARKIGQRGGEETNTALGISVARYCPQTFEQLYILLIGSPRMTFTEHNLLSMDIYSSEAFKQGGRRGAKKVMIVITDGESHDSADLQQVIEDSENDGITRYAIAVSIAFLQFTSHSFLLFLL